MPSGPQQPYGQQPGPFPPPQPGGYGQPGPYGPQPGYPQGGYWPGPPRRKNPLPWILAGGGAVVVAVAVVLVITLTGNDNGGSGASNADRSTARSTAEALVSAIEGKDAVTGGAGGGKARNNDEEYDLTITELTENGDRAEAEVDAGEHGGGTMKLKNDGDQWCVEKFSF